MYKKDLEGVKYQQEVFLENNKRYRIHYFLFWHFRLYSGHLKGEVNCEQEKFSIKEDLGFTSWDETMEQWQCESFTAQSWEVRTVSVNQECSAQWIINSN